MASSVSYTGYAEAVAALRELAGIDKSKEWRGFVKTTQSTLDKDWKQRTVAGVTGKGETVPDRPGIASRRRKPYAGKRGAPGTPRGKSSRLCSAYKSGTTRNGLNFTYVGTVVGVKFAKFLVGRYKYAGLSPTAVARIKADLDRTVAALVRKRGGKAK